MLPESEEYAVFSTANNRFLIDVSATDDGYSFSDPEGNEPDQRLDYIFADPGLAEKVARFAIDRSAVGSDHWPLFLELD